MGGHTAWRQRVTALRQDTYALYLASRDPRVPRAPKVLLLVVLAYALSPIDLIPDFIPVLGYLDDVILVPLGIALAIRLIPEGVWEECKEQARDRAAAGLPHSRVAAIAIVSIWLAVAGLAGWLVWRWVTV